jgi:hypothetical protein
MIAANAQLMAAAPDLLDALVAVHYWNLEGQDGFPARYVESVIAKAEGRA